MWGKGPGAGDHLPAAAAPPPQGRRGLVTRGTCAPQVDRAAGCHRTPSLQDGCFTARGAPPQVRSGWLTAGSVWLVRVSDRVLTPTLPDPLVKGGISGHRDSKSIRQCAGFVSDPRSPQGRPPGLQALVCCPCAHWVQRKHTGPVGPGLQSWFSGATVLAFWL